MMMKFIPVALVCAALVCGCHKPAADGPGAGSFPATQVIAIEARRQPVSETLSLVGSIAASEMVEIKSETDGKVEGINFKEGETVAAGRLLFQLDDSKLTNGVAARRWQRGATPLETSAKAPGCGARSIAPLGFPQQLAAQCSALQPQTSLLQRSPLGLIIFPAATQGSSFLATLGWMTQSLWDCRNRRTIRPAVRLSFCCHIQKYFLTNAIPE